MRILYVSSEDREIFREKDEIGRDYRQLYNDDDIENMKRYFKVEDNHDALLRYIKGNRIAHER